MVVLITVYKSQEASVDVSGCNLFPSTCMGQNLFSFLFTLNSLADSDTFPACHAMQSCIESGFFCFQLESRGSSTNRARHDFDSNLGLKSSYI